MLLDAWASYFAQAKAAGKGDLIEDDDFDLNQILADLERQEGDASALTEDPPEAVPDDWEPVDDWHLEGPSRQL
jgi:hypothetical protein